MSGAGEKPDGPAEPAAAELPSGYLEIYKLAVEMADRVSARRGLANTFFLTINTGLAALLGGKDLRWYVAVAGIALCAAWWGLLRSYQRLNGAKFSVILDLETSLPAQPFGDEWKLLKPEEAAATTSAPSRRDAMRARMRAYRELGRIERVVPAIFALIYVAEIVRQALR